jgi:hypothetical protein
MNILKMIGQSFVNAALPAIKAELKGRAAMLINQPKYSGISSLLMVFLSELLDGWTIKI